MSQTKNTKKGNELFFVQIAEPSEVRRNILETLKEILVILQKFEKFRQMRHVKVENVHKLRILLREANKMMSELRNKLPQTDLKAVSIRREEPRPVARETIKEAPVEKPKKKEMSELEKLEAELSSIENKLRSLN